MAGASTTLAQGWKPSRPRAIYLGRRADEKTDNR